MAMNFELILRNSIAWKNDKKVWIYLIVLIAISIGFLAATAFFMEEIITKAITSYLQSPDLMATLALLIESFVLFISFALLIGLINGFIYALIVLKGMNHYKIKTASFGTGKYIKLLVLQILSFFAALISCYNKKFFFFFMALVLLYVFSLAALFVSPSIGWILFAIALIATIPYSLVVIYNSFRLSMAPFIFLEKKGIFDSLEESHKITSGRVMDIFVAMLIISLLIGVISFFADQIGQALLLGVFPEFNIQGNPNMLQLLSLASSLMQNAAEMIILAGFISTIINSIMHAVTAYAYVGIYSQVKTK